MRKSKLEIKREVFKHSAAIQIHNSITLLQRRVWNVLLFNAYNELETEEEHHIALAELVKLIGYDSHDMDYLKEAAKVMMNCIVEWDVLGKDGSPEWGATPLLAQAEIKRGILTYAYSPALRRRLHNPSIYARLDLNLQKQFVSKYGLALWELCADYLWASREYGETPFIPLEKYRKLMGLKDGGYPKFKEFNRCAVKEPMAEINQVSDFQVTAEYQRQRRKVTALKFKMRRVSMLPEPANGQRNLFPPLEDMPVLVKELKDTGLAPSDAWEIWQRGFDFVEKAARPAVNTEAAFLQYIREKIHLLKRRLAASKVENSTGFLLEAIRKNYANPEYVREREREVVTEARKAKKEQDKQVERLKVRQAEIENARDRELDDIYRQIALESSGILETAVPEVLTEKPFLREFYKPGQSALENYQASPMFKTVFNPYLERFAPERIEAVRMQYAPEIAGIEEKIAALQGS
jgi:hypothetical protein